MAICLGFFLSRGKISSRARPVINFPSQQRRGPVATLYYCHVTGWTNSSEGKGTVQKEYFIILVINYVATSCREAKFIPVIIPFMVGRYPWKRTVFQGASLFLAYFIKNSYHQLTFTYNVLDDEIMLLLCTLRDVQTD